MNLVLDTFSSTRVMALPATVVYFTIYDEIRRRLGSIVLKPNDQADIMSSEVQTHQQLPLWVPMISGGSARVLAATMISPLELLRTKMQSRPLTYGQLAEAVKQLLAVEGVRGLYKGLTPTILRDVPFSCIYWAGYEWLRTKLSTATPPSFGASFVAGAFSGALAAVLTLPFDVVKTHRQIELGERLAHTSNPLAQSSGSPHQTSQLLIHIYKRRGMQGLFAGLGPRVIKVAPACAIMISTYEMGKSFFARQNAALTEQ
jgi:solute carrier family 25 protein 39/40